MNHPITVAAQFRVPVLASDAYLGEGLNKFGTGPRLKLERRIVWNLIRHLSANGFHPNQVDVGDGDWIEAMTPRAVMEAVFSVDSSEVLFRKADGRGHWVAILLGNGEYCISDWSYGTDDPDGFDLVMSAFDVEQYF